VVVLPARSCESTERLTERPLEVPERKVAKTHHQVDRKEKLQHGLFLLSIAEKTYVIMRGCCVGVALAGPMDWKLQTFQLPRILFFFGFAGKTHTIMKKSEP